MTASETQSLAPGDLITWGSHPGRVLGVKPDSVSVEWTPGKATIHRRDQMTAVRRAGIDLAAETNGGTHALS